MKKVLNFGGNFFTVKGNKKSVDLYTTNSKGNYFKLDVVGLNPADISTFGGNYFMTNKGLVYTVSSEGFVFSKPDSKVGLLKLRGGNFFIDVNNRLYTVSDEGYLLLPTLPANLKVASITKVGANYLQSKEGLFFTVDSSGTVAERKVDAHDLTNLKVFSM